MSAVGSDQTQAALLSSIVERIASNSAAITSFLKQNDSPPELTNKSNPFDVLVPPNAPEEIRTKQEELLNLALELQTIATDPYQFLQRQAAQNNQFYCLRWIFHFNIHANVPQNSAITYACLASQTGVPERQLTSIARMAILAGFFSEPEPGKLAHNRLSAAFAVPSLSDLGSFLTNVSAPMPTKMVEATEKWGGSQSKAHTAYNVVNDTELPIFEHTAGIPELREQYAQYMKNQAATEGLSPMHLVRGFDWASLGDVTVIDVGGSLGHASAALAAEFPELNFVVQDLPATVEKARSLSPTLFSPSVLERISYQEHDFFQPQPQPSGRKPDVFLLRMILHDWKDDDAAKILKNLASAMGPKVRNKHEPRMIIMDIVMPDAAGSISRVQEMQLRVRDLTMLQAHNARERELRDWYALIDSADCGLVLRNHVRPFNSILSIMEVAIKE
ncbi:sterigmatocystin 8-O-methyltransferase [Massariosphaeria phaeospora]|uniref:Sterigmatocystin 8-O-methyltransferase n=1 Tax=Massariosphaeria phaeospora TaxID=100035 RepID=A0A7C8I0N7_9PLEO|nr:sterigmatocystin 8-O-methyltransferase [Massariosphaeria phaeospora]